MKPVDDVLGYIGREGDCASCRQGHLHPVITSYVVSVSGVRIRVGNLIAMRCQLCGRREHFSREVERAREIARLRLEARLAA